MHYALGRLSPRAHSLGRRKVEVAAERIGVMGGDCLEFGRHGSLGLAPATATWREAIPRRMN